MGTAYVDMSRYFQNTVANPGYRVLLDPRTGQINVQKRTGVTGQFFMDAPNFDPGQFYGKTFASAYGLPLAGPGGENLFNVRDWNSAMSNVQKLYGVDFSSFMGMDPTKREQMYSKTLGIGKDSETGLDALFDPRTGLPNRPPRNAMEALQFQFRADQETRRLNQGLLNNAIGTLRYGLGGINRGGPFSTYGLMSPLLGQMSSTYMNSQYDSPDYSYFLRPDVPGYGTFGAPSPQPIPQIPSVPGLKGIYNAPMPTLPPANSGMVAPAQF